MQFCAECGHLANLHTLERMRCSWDRPAACACSGLVASLTPREAQVMRALAKGYTEKEVACQLALSPKTITAHCSNLMRKLRIHNRSQLILHALRSGLLSLDDVPAENAGVPLRAAAAGE